MTQPQINAILGELGAAEDQLVDFSNSDLSYINFSKYENKFVNPKICQFYFDSINQMVTVYPCRKKEGQPIEYLYDSQGIMVGDTYSYDSIYHFQMRGEIQS